MHMLVFPTLWSAATGYISPTDWIYQMPDGKLLEKDSPQLAFCWDCTDCSRIGLGEHATLLSSSFNKLLPSFAKYDALLRQVDMSENTPRIHKRILFNKSTWRLNLGTLAILAHCSIVGIVLHGLQLRSTYYLLDTSSTAYLLSLVKEWSSTSAIQLASESFPVGYNQYCDASRGHHFFAYETAGHPTRDPEWVFNGSLLGGPNIVPYNSSIRIDNKTHLLDAPLLRYAVPTSSDYSISPISPSVCYNGEVLPHGWLSPSGGHLVCFGKTNFVWGFSATLAGICLMLQSVWFYLIWHAWIFWKWHTKVLDKQNIRGTSRSVSALNEAMEQHIGKKAALLTDRGLKKSLKNCGDVGWVTRRTGHGESFYYVLSTNVQDAVVWTNRVATGGVWPGSRQRQKLSSQHSSRGSVLSVPPVPMTAAIVC
ncbi:MAG: hypothetical protein M1820_010491 [Bogoriella megaspora]|nr:MAG: hypothetical protein M1820_010491 [Bogoriella megaspora]